MDQKKKKRFSIGVDPGKKTGFAAYDRLKDEINSIATSTFWDVVDLMHKHFPPKDVHQVIVELPRNKNVWHDKAVTRGAIERTGVNVGSVIREAELLIEHFKRAGYSVITQHPYGKLTHQNVKKLTGYQGKTNEHTRDAIMLCYGV